MAQKVLNAISTVGETTTEVVEAADTGKEFRITYTSGAGDLDYRPAGHGDYIPLAKLESAVPGKGQYSQKFVTGDLIRVTSTVATGRVIIDTVE